MPIQVQDVVKFRGDRLFHGAVNIDWFLNDEEKCRAAAEAFIFHGPKYHGVTQVDVGSTHGHQLQDTASFIRAIVRRCCGLEDQPFTLTIAGYGTGKSHLALTLAVLLANPTNGISEHILSSLDVADSGIGSEIRAMLRETNHPCLIVALNGMGSFDLTAELIRQVVQQIRVRNMDTRPLDELRPRFKQAATLIRMSSDTIIKELLDACGTVNRDAILNALERQDEHVYAKVHEFFASQGMPIRALGGESVQDVIDVVAREYCGVDKPFRRLLILFDEFGRYTEFATVRSQVAGSGVLQDMFEGIQGHADTACFVGFIQFELNAYVQRVAPEFKNEILRYVTRYQSASKVYLSTNLETLIAHLLEKQDPDKLDSWFDGELARRKSQEIINNLNSWFPQSRNYRLWSDPEQFHTVIRKGCWPLSPYATWFLFYLAAAGKHLQERSALTLLGDFFQNSPGFTLSDEGNWSLAPVDLWSDELQQEFISSEETGQQGSITHAFSSVYARHGAQLPDRLIRILRGVVLASKMGLQVGSRDEAVMALAALTGLSLPVVRDGATQLQEEYNVLDWDDRFKSFDILGDAIPRTQFLAFIRQRVASIFDEDGKAKLFVRKASEWCDLLGDIESNFAEDNSITTKEWRYQGITSNLEILQTHIKFATDRWEKAVAVDEPRGTIIYCYVGQSYDPDAAASEAKRLLRSAARESDVARENGTTALPILVLLLYDENGTLGQALAELAVLEESITDEDRARFGNLIGAHKEKTLQGIRNQIEEMIKNRQYVTSLSEELEAHRLVPACTELFKRIYKKPLSFPFDGFSTAKGNAADSCQELTIELLRGKLDYDAVMAKPIKVKNRAVTVLRDNWGFFHKSGAMSMRPLHPVARAVTEKWDDTLQSNQQQFIIGNELRQLCLPPYGANIASAGLLLGIFVAPRVEKLAIVRDGQQYDVSQWVMDSQDRIFRSKFLDLMALKDVALAFIGEASSEWESFLDEWEQAESYLDRANCLERAEELKKRVPVPPASNYRFFHLEELAKAASIELKKMDSAQNDAINKLELGFKQDSISILSWGAVSLMELIERMTSEGVLWTRHQTEELQPLVERARQIIIQIFPAWLARQAPKDDSPDSIGNFKHKMLRLVGNNLKRLGLDEQYNELEARTNLLIRNAETAADARKLIRDVRSWLEQHRDACRIPRIAKIRGYLEVGKDFSNKLQGMSRRTEMIEMVELSEIRSDLAEFMDKLKKAESEIMARTRRIWLAKLRSIEELERLIDEVEELTGAFEGCQDDLDDFRVIRSVLQAYQGCYRQLQNEGLTWQEFNSRAEKLRQEIEATYGEAEIPWPVDETFGSFVDIITKQRNQASLSWIEAVESEASDIATMPAPDANRLHTKANNPPSVLTEQHEKRLAKLIKQIEVRLETLALDWLIEKFQALPESAKKKFLKLASQILSES
ncbi:MAG: hypothetical protein AB1611_04555 [bacterium]